MFPRRFLAIVLIAAVAVIGGTLGMSVKTTSASPGITTQDLTTSLTAADVANALVGGGISISNVTYTGAQVAAGTFAGGTGIIGFESGIILSTGSLANVIGPNTVPDISMANGTPGDAQLNTLASFPTFDAAVLEFDFVPQASSVSFQYVFASDEYNEFVNSDYNDVFAFYVNGVNCATVPGPNGPQPVTINTVNNGDPYGTPPNSNPGLFVNNDVPTPTLDTQMDGLTVVLTCQANVNAGVSNHMKLAIADASDDIYDSDVFLKAQSFAIPTNTPTETATATPVTPGAPTNTPSATATSTPGTPVATNTPTQTPTSTPVTPTSTPTNTPIATATAVAPTRTATAGGQAGATTLPRTGDGGSTDSPIWLYLAPVMALGLALAGAGALRLRKR